LLRALAGVHTRKCRTQYRDRSGNHYSQVSPKKNFTIRERLNLPLRFDFQNPFHTVSATRVSRWISKTAVVWKDYRRSDDGFLGRPAAGEFDAAAKLVNR
jgi:hypothetical protein